MMTSAARAMQPEPAPLTACTIARDVQNFDLLIEDMEAELGEAWGDLTFREAAVFLRQPEAEGLEFVAIALDAADEGDLPLVGELIRIAKERGIRVILIAEELGPAVLHRLLKLGADDFVPYPLPEGALHEAVARLRGAAAGPGPLTGAGAAPAAAEAEEPPAAPRIAMRGDRHGAVLPVHKLCGGAGATTFATNLAWELATAPGAEGKRVCLIDLDFQFGSVATYLDLQRREAIDELLTNASVLDAEALRLALQSFQEKLFVFTAPADMLPLEIVSPGDVGRLIDTARGCFDFVVIDMPQAIVQWTETVLQAADVCFALLELDMRSAQNALRLIRALKAEDLPHRKLRYVLNRAPRLTDLAGKARARRLAESLDITIEVQLPDGGREVTAANDHGAPLGLHAPKNPVRREIQKLAKSLHEVTRSAAAGRA